MKTAEAVLKMFFAQALLLSPRAYFFCRPERSEGSLGTCAPWDDIPKRRPERSEGRRPERSEGCLVIARQDNKKDARYDKKWGLGRTR